MKYLFDSSAIFTAIKENKVEALAGNCTLDLARYELGNIIWKDYVLQAKISEQDARSLARVVKHTLAVMDVLSAADVEEEILGTAAQLKITFYDAAYVYFAKMRGLILVTEDLPLIKKVSAKVNTSTFEDM